MKSGELSVSRTFDWKPYVPGTDRGIILLTRVHRTRRGGRGRLTATLFAWLPRSRSHVPTVAQNDAVIQIVTLIRTERI